MNNLELNQMKIDGAMEKLENNIESLMNQLRTELETLRILKEKGIEYKPNFLGIVQDKGREIDNICGRLGGLYEMKSILDGSSDLLIK
jgi:hypothetical protein